MNHRTRSVQEWARRIAAQEASGLTAAEYCRRERVALKRFYWWRQQLAEAKVPRFVALTVAAESPGSSLPI